MAIIFVHCKFGDIRSGRPNYGYYEATHARLADLAAILYRIKATRGTLKMRDWKMWDWNYRHQTAGVENAGLENSGTENVWNATCGLT